MHGVRKSAVSQIFIEPCPPTPLDLPAFNVACNCRYQIHALSNIYHSLYCTALLGGWTTLHTMSYLSTHMKSLSAWELLAVWVSRVSHTHHHVSIVNAVIRQGHEALWVPLTVDVDGQLVATQLNSVGPPATTMETNRDHLNVKLALMSGWKYNSKTLS